MHSLALIHIDTEFNDEESDDSVEQHEQNPGVDDGFFVERRADTDHTNDDKHEPHHTHNHNDDVPHENPPFPFAPGFNPNVVSNQNTLTIYRHRIQIIFGSFG